MIYVVISAKPSTRFPGKNKRLAPYAIAWVERERTLTAEAVQVYTVGFRSEFPEELPEDWLHIECSEGSHKADLAHAEEEVVPVRGGVFVQVQLTQPLRRTGLLQDLANAVRAGRYGTAVTYVVQPSTPAWRVLSAEGSWPRCKTPEPLRLLDGACFAWLPGRLPDIFIPHTQHAAVYNYTGDVVDVDYPSDIPDDLQQRFDNLTR